MPQLCGCFHSTAPEPSTSQVSVYPEAGFMHRVDSQSQPPRYDSVDSGYTPVVPLPRYTPHPMGTHEKSIRSNFHEQQRRQQQSDEKNLQYFEEPDVPIQAHSTGGSSSVTVTATMDDASSAYSFPSSFGHTSTDTRDTPPPPYSSCGSLYSRSRASSMRSSHHRRSDSLSNNFPLSNNHQQTGSSSDSSPATMIAPPPTAHLSNSSLSTFALSMAHAAYNTRQPVSRPPLNRRRSSWESR